MAYVLRNTSLSGVVVYTWTKYCIVSYLSLCVDSIYQSNLLMVFVAADTTVGGTVIMVSPLVLHDKH